MLMLLMKVFHFVVLAARNARAILTANFILIVCHSVLLCCAGKPKQDFPVPSALVACDNFWRMGTGDHGWGLECAHLLRAQTPGRPHPNPTARGHIRRMARTV